MPDVFDGVVLVDIQIAFGVDRKIEPSMLGKQLQHMIQKANAGRYLVRARTFDPQRAADLCFFRNSFDGGFSHVLNLFCVSSVLATHSHRQHGECAVFSKAFSSSE